MKLNIKWFGESNKCKILLRETKLNEEYLFE